MTLAAEEYRALRATIASRGTVRMLLLPLTATSWAILSAALLLFASLPMASLLSLAVLAAGCESIRALHVGVERIGRFVQVFYEEPAAGAADVRPRWEVTAMAAPTESRSTLPGGGVDPLFSVFFACAAIVNITVAIVPGPTMAEGAAAGAMHLAFLARVAATRIAAGSQRAKDLEHYRALRDKSRA